MGFVCHQGQSFQPPPVHSTKFRCPTPCPGASRSWSLGPGTHSSEDTLWDPITSREVTGLGVHTYRCRQPGAQSETVAS